MELSKFLQIMNKYFGDKVEATEGTTNDSDRLVNFLDAFIYDAQDIENHPLDTRSPDTKRKYYSGHDSLPKDVANFYLARLSADAFGDYSFELEDESVQNMADDFRQYEITISPHNFAEDVTSVLKEILSEISNKAKKLPIQYAKFLDGNRVQIGRQIINIPEVLEEISLEEPYEDKYINALLEVYAIDANLPLEEVTVESLEAIDPIYSEHFKIQRRNYFKAEAIFHLIRDSFSNGEEEFERLEQETYAGIQSTLFGRYASPFDKVNETMKHVTLLTYGRSYLGRPDNGFVGAEEKQGVVHMLVNDGRIVWVR